MSYYTVNCRTRSIQKGTEGKQMLFSEAQVNTEKHQSPVYQDTPRADDTGGTLILRNKA